MGRASRPRSTKKQVEITESSALAAIGRGLLALILIPTIMVIWLLSWLIRIITKPFGVIYGWIKAFTKHLEGTGAE